MKKRFVIEEMMRQKNEPACLESREEEQFSTKEKFQKSNFRPWNFLEEFEQLEAKAELEQTSNDEGKIKWEL